MPMPFEFVIEGPPVSQQNPHGRRKRKWKQRVRNAAERRWDSKSPFVGEVMVTITYFFSGASLDVDNIPKPILDALNGLIFLDDTQVSDLLCRKRDRMEDLRIQNPSLLLLENLHKSSQFLHVNVATALSQEVAI